MARILIIEDVPENMELMRYLLTAFGHEVLSATDGCSGLDAASKVQPELIVCDVHLPGIDGYELVRQVRALQALKTVPIVAVTALAMVGDRERGLAAGFDGYLYKPIDPETFVNDLQRYLSRSNQAEELRSSGQLPHQDPGRKT